MELLIFYYIFSVLFEIGYVDFREINGVGLTILAILSLLIFAPIVFPINLGIAVSKTK